MIITKHRNDKLLIQLKIGLSQLMEKLVKICDQKLKLAANYQIGLKNFCPNCTKQRDSQGES